MTVSSNKQFDRCILHVGCEKTGTSSIQLFLSVNRPLWKKEGVLYPVACGSLYGGSQWNFAAIAQREPWVDELGRRMGIASPDDQQELAGRVFNEVQREQAEMTDPHNLVISSEHFHSRLKCVEEIAALKAFLEPLTLSFEIIIYFRRQDRVAASLYSTHIKSGNLSPTPFLPALDAPEAYYFNYAQVYWNWMEVFGEAAMRPRVYSPAAFETGDLIRDFCSTSGLEYEGKRRPEPQNVSLDAAGSRFLVAVNRLLAKDPMRSASDRELLIKMLEQVRPGRTYPFNREAARNFLAQFSEINQWLARVAFPGSPPELFDDDFSDYPDGQFLPEGDHPEAVAIGLELWKGLLGI